MTPWRAIGALAVLLASAAARPDGRLARKYRTWAMEHPDGSELPLTNVDFGALRHDCAAAVVVIGRTPEQDFTLLIEGNLQGPLQDGVELRTDVMAGLTAPQRGAQLAEHLGLADGHRGQTGGHRERVGDAPLALGREVLPERPSERDVEDLQAAADAEDGQIGRASCRERV